MSNTQQAGAAQRLKIVIAFAAVYTIWGSTYLAIRFAIDTLPPFLMAGSRFLLSGTFLFVWMRLRGDPLPSRRHWISGAIIGGLMLLGGNGGVTWSEQRVPSGLAALMIATVPLWMGLLDWLRPGGKRPHAGVIVGLVLGFTGIALLVGPVKLAGGSHIDPLGAGVLVLGALCWSIGSLYSRTAEMPASPLLGTSLEMLCGGAWLWLAGTLAGEWGRLNLAAVSFRSAGAFAYLVVFGSLIGFSAYVWLLKAVPPARASTYAYVNPVVAVFLGWAVAGETLSPRTMIAAAVIIGAVVMITTFQGREEPPVLAALESEIPPGD